VTAESTFTLRNHTIGLDTYTSCLWRYSDGSYTLNEDGQLAEVTSVKLSSIDGEPPKSTVGFTISFDQRRRQLLGFLSSPGPNRDDQDSIKWRSLSTSVPVPLTTGVVKQNEISRPSVDDEVRKQRILEDEIRELRRLLHKQKVFVESLTKDQTQDADNQITQCGDVGCIWRAIYSKAKGCLDMVYVGFRGSHKEVAGMTEMHNSTQLSEFDCLWPQSRQERTIALLQGAKICLNPPVAHSNTGPVSHDVLDDTDSLSNSLDSEPEASSTDPKRPLYIAISVVASLLCLTCITACLHRQCCHPRTRAERAARREERRTARQYRCLARRQAWRNWWSRHSFRRTHDRNGDYEEKRALILQQEAILENVMQEEIRELHNAHGVFLGVAGAAEEGRAPLPQMSQISRRTTSPPSYRSRASSGRPPSYNEFDDNTGDVVVDGFYRYTPSGTNCTPEGTESTPDSSVVSVSPRLSFETLRTERSAF